MFVYFVKIFVLIVAFSTTLFISSTDAHAVNYSWLGPIERTSMAQLSADAGGEDSECYGHWELVYIEEETRRGCIYGDPGVLQFVTYRVSAGVVESALRFVGESTYHVVDICRDWGCIYSSFSDTLFVPMNNEIHAIRHVSGMSHRRNDKGLYELGSSPSVHLVAVLPKRQQAGTAVVIASSLNQQWLVAEAIDRTYLVIDARTLTVRRITVRPFGEDSTKKLRMAISHDGAFLALFGDRNGSALVSILSCRDKEGTVVQSCYQTISTRQLHIPSDLSSTRNVRFSSDGNRLSYDAILTSGARYSITLQAKAIDNPPPGLFDYLAIGDSFSSGEGEDSDIWYMRGSNTTNHKCHTSSRAYSTILGASWGLRSRTVACSGARFRDVSSTGEYKGQADRLANYADDESIKTIQERALIDFLPGRIPQIDFVRHYKPRFITIGIGGNDAGFASKLKACFSFGTCDWAKDGAWRRAAAKEIDNLSSLYRDVFSQLQEASPESKITVIGYPIMMSESWLCLSSLGTMFNFAERQFVAMATRRLNSVMAYTANAEGLQYVDINDAYKNARLCDGVGTVAINSVRTGDDMGITIGKLFIPVLGAESFHPTAAGHALTASSILNRYSKEGFFDRVSTGSAAISSDDKAYWGSDVAITDAPLMKNEIFLEKESIAVGDSVTISLKARSFAENAKIFVELHSTPIALAEGIASSSGDFHLTVPIPMVPEGYHTMVVKGVNDQGEEIQYYTDLYVAGGSDSSPANIDAVDRPTVLGASVGANEQKPRLDNSDVSQVSVLAEDALTSDDNAAEKSVNSLSAMLLILLCAVIVVLMLISGYNSYMNIRKVVKRLIPVSLFRRIEPFGHLVEAILANVRYGFPARKLKIIGVTGTNGKTTTSFMIHRLLHEAGINVAITTTVGYGVGDDIKPQIAHITTAQAGILQKRLRDFARAGMEWVVVETSSHALAQHRTWGIPYEVAVLTNITHDHLDYHGNFKNYANAKRRLFRIANKHGRRFGVVNADDASSKLFAKVIKRSLSYGLEKGDLRASGIDLQSDGSSFIATVKGDSYSLRVNIPGQFNVSNALAAVAVGRELGLTKKQIEKGIAALKGVEGRMNVISEGQSFKVLVDFASTPDGFEKFFESVRPLVKGKLIAVFGSAGRRDESKRAVQGAIAGKYADVVVVTEEDDRDDDGARILKQIASGAKKSGKVEGKTLYIEPSRENAIGFAMTLATTRDDTVVLLGKGHEKTIERADGEYPWSDTEVARTALHELLKKSQ